MVLVQKRMSSFLILAQQLSKFICFFQIQFFQRSIKEKVNYHIFFSILVSLLNYCYYFSLHVETLKQKQVQIFRTCTLFNIKKQSLLRNIGLLICIYGCAINLCAVGQSNNRYSSTIFFFPHFRIFSSIQNALMKFQEGRILRGMFIIHIV